LSNHQTIAKRCVSVIDRPMYTVINVMPLRSLDLIFGSAPSFMKDTS